MHPKYSFIIIAYNEARTIARCIDSILALDTLSDYEIVVVDDGSKDATAAIVTEYAKKNPAIKLHPHTTNQGRGAARSTGVRAAAGEYFAFVDADIILTKNWLATCCAQMDSYDAVGGIAVPDGDVNYVYCAFELDPKAAKHSTTVTGSNGLYKRKIFDAIAFDPDLRDGEDVVFNHLMTGGGYKTLSIGSLVVAHRESKTFLRSMRWLYQSGLGAARQFKQFRQVRLPDIAYFGSIFILIGSIVTALFTHNLLVLVLFPLCVLGTSFIHLSTRFHFHMRRAISFGLAVVVHALFIVCYYAGRTVGIFIANSSHKDRSKKVMVCFDLEGLNDTRHTHSYDLVATTHAILDTLTRHNVRAVFFIVGTLVEEYPALVTEIAAQGHVVGLHGYAHEHLDTYSAEARAQFDRDLARVTAHVESLTGTRPVAFRAPYLLAPRSYDKEIYAILEKNGYTWASNRDLVYTEELFRDRFKVRFLWGKNTWYTTVLAVILNWRVILSEDFGTSKRGIGRMWMVISWLWNGTEPYQRGSILEVPVYSPLDGDLLSYVSPGKATAEGVVQYTIDALASGVHRKGSWYSLNFHDWVIGTDNRLRILDEVLFRLAQNSHVRFLTTPEEPK
jgi:glycosyltransferase involved in cell wall biosynthesis/peptidoglycan/xylan/chitin deacetylase (PgdA/CDA1 family)